MSQTENNKNSSGLFQPRGKDESIVDRVHTMVADRGSRARSFFFVVTLIAVCFLIQPTDADLMAFTGLSIMVILFTIILGLFNKIYDRNHLLSPGDFVLLCSLLLTTVGIAKFLIYFMAKVSALFPSIAPQLFAYMVPYAAAIMVIQLVITRLPVFTFIVFQSFLIGILFNFSFKIAVFAFASSLYGALIVRKVQTRASLFSATMNLTFFNLLLALVFEGLIEHHHALDHLLYTGTFALVSIIPIFIVVSVALVVIEQFDYVTDMRLIELANFNNPLLNRLALEAPGTYHHSRVVAQMVEAAANSIEAHPLLSMVSALYHDIGKTKAPQYFVENQGPEDRNTHDKLKPSMSKMIVISHVKDGIEMAKRAGLPQAIINAIPEHHGTSLISFFYSKAKEQEDPAVDTIKENEYRYPGPKPQSRETALLLLADSVEATAKSLPEPTSGRIQQVIQKIFNKYFIDGQLDECDLTLKDLNLIAKSFHRTLTSVYKPRLEYPDVPAGGTNQKRTKSQDGSRNQQPTKETSNKDQASEDSDEDDLKRLGM